MSRRWRLHSSGARAAFSMVEMMVVVIILGLVSGVVVVSWKALLPNQKLNTAVRNLSEVLHGTRNDSIARNREFQIWYNLDEDRYAVRTPFRPEGGFAVSEDEERIWIHDTNLQPEGITIVEITIDDEKYHEGDVYVRFDPLGAASNHRIVLRQDLFDREFTIEVLPLTGDIRFHDGYYEREPADEGDFD